MKRVVFAIPSYHRSDRQPFLKYLNLLGVPRDDIYITIQNDEDRRAYSKWEPLCRIVGENGTGVSFNRNQCLRVAPDARLVMCDDGIHALFVKQPSGKCEKVRTHERLMGMLDKMFGFCEAHGVSVFSLNNSSMGLCASGEDFIDHPFVSIFMGVVDRRVQFDNGVKFLEDVERNLRILRGGGTPTASATHSTMSSTARRAVSARCTKTRVSMRSTSGISPPTIRAACPFRSGAASAVSLCRRRPTARGRGFCSVGFSSMKGSQPK